MRKIILSFIIFFCFHSCKDSAVVKPSENIYFELQGEVIILTDTLSHFIEGIKVRLSSDSAYTNSNGEFIFDSLSAGDYFLTIVKPGYTSIYESIHVTNQSINLEYTIIELATRPISTVAKDYLNSALDIMQNNSINRYSIDWPTFRENTFNHAGNVQTIKETYFAIIYAIKNIGDHHSFFMEPPHGNILSKSLQTENYNNFNSAQATNELLGLRLRNNIGFLRIPEFSGTGTIANNFANEIQNIIKEIDTSEIKGWVIDLRGNRGGNMWPMLAGVGPILGNGLAGKFIDPDSNVYNWHYQDGKSIGDNQTISEVDCFYTLFNPNPFVGVLTDGLTISSGEAITISFKARPKTKSFGDYTFGLSTANQGFPLSDGAVIYLTFSTMADRTGKMYGSKIKPDEIVIGEIGSNPAINDSVVTATINWLDENL